MLHALRMFAVLSIVAILAVPTVVLAQSVSSRVPGHQKARYDEDGNGYPEAGVVVTGKYTSMYAYDVSEDWYWDLGDGRVQGTVGSVEELDPETVPVCDYQVHYRSSFENDPYQDTGWITNNIHCHGSDGNGTYNYQIVHRSAPRFTGSGMDAGWGPDWEYHVNTESGSGNLARPESHVGEE
jgi:hypothetical protein